MCLVHEYTTTSAPMVSGCCNSGVANTLSTTTIAPAACARAATAVRSTISSIGLDGVSNSTKFVGLLNASRHCVRSEPSTNTDSMPNLGSNVETIQWHEPNKARDA